MKSFKKITQAESDWARTSQSRELTPERAKFLEDFVLEMKGLIPKKKRMKSVKVTTRIDKDGNKTIKSTIKYS